jgi:hypothetical protein
MTKLNCTLEAGQQLPLWRKVSVTWRDHNEALLRCC